MGVYAQLKVTNRDSYIISNIVHTILSGKKYNKEKFIKPEDYHATLLYSRTGDSKDIQANTKDIITAKIKDVVCWDTHDKCVVLTLTSDKLKHRHLYLMRKYSLEWDYPDYKPHITILYDLIISDKNLSELKKRLIGRNITLTEESIEELDEEHSDVE